MSPNNWLNVFFGIKAINRPFIQRFQWPLELGSGWPDSHLEHLERRQGELPLDIAECQEGKHVCVCVLIMFMHI